MTDATSYGSLVGTPASTESSLSNWVGPYATDMLGRAQALADMPYQAYQGPLTAGASAGQQAAFEGIANLAVPTDQMGGFTPQSFTDAGVAQQYMSPYLQAALDPQLAEARRQAEIQRVQDASRLTQAGGYGGSRQAIMEAEGARNLMRNLSDITGTGYQQAFTQAQNQFNAEQGMRQQAQNLTNQYGLSALQQQANLGAQERAIESEGIAADYAQFMEERDYPYKQIQFLHSLLQGMPVGTQSQTYNEPGGLAQFAGSMGGIMDIYKTLFGGG